MVTHILFWIAGGFAVALFVSLVACADETKNLETIPKAVIESLKSKFPNAKIARCTKESKSGTVIYDLEFTQDGKKAKMDLKEVRTIINIERAISARDLPRAVAEAMEQKSPKATLLEVMEIKAGKEEKFESYEIILETMDTKKFELILDPAGEIVEAEELKK